MKVVIPVNTVKIKVWLIMNGLRQSDIARDLKNATNLVWMVVNNVQPNKRVLAAFLARGCPHDILGLSVDEASKLVFNYLEDKEKEAV